MDGEVHCHGESDYRSKIMIGKKNGYYLSDL